MTAIGKFRHLSRCATEAGHFVILAIDHRGILRTALDSYAEQPLTDAEFATFKQDVIRPLAVESSAVLLDPDIIPDAVRSGALRPAQGLLAPLELTSYDVHPSQRATEFIPAWSPRHIKRAGGDGVKLLLYYHPDAANAENQRSIVRRIVDECGQEDIPFFLEPITYSLDPSLPLPNADLRQITVAMTAEFSAMGVDILKLQFPVDAAQSRDEAEWRAACAEVDAAAAVPWTLLSAGVDFDTFVLQTQIACQSGASGVIVGRAVWNDAVTLQADAAAQREFLTTTGCERIRQLAALCATYAANWSTKM